MVGIHFTDAGGEMAGAECFESFDRLPADLSRMMSAVYKVHVLIDTNTRTFRWLVGLCGFVLGLMGALATVLVPLALLSSHALVEGLAVASVGTMMLAVIMLTGILAREGRWFIPSSVRLEGQVYSATFVWNDSRVPLLMALRQGITAWNEEVPGLNELVAHRNIAGLSDQESNRLRLAEHRHAELREKIELLDYLCSLGCLGEFREPVPVSRSPIQKPTELVFFAPNELEEALRAAKES